MPTSYQAPSLALQKSEARRFLSYLLAAQVAPVTIGWPSLTQLLWLHLVRQWLGKGSLQPLRHSRRIITTPDEKSRLTTGASSSEKRRLTIEIADQKLKVKSKLEYDYASIILREDPLTLQIGGALKMSPAAIDKAFREASKL